MMKLSLLGVLMIAALAQAETTPAGVECMSDLDCDLTECCYKKHDLLIVSKKRQQHTFEGYPINPVDYTHRKGVCQSYKNEGDFCSTFDKRNGYCSCNDKLGHSCQFVHSSDNGHSGTFMCQAAPLTVS